MAPASPSVAVFVRAPSWRAALGALAVSCVLVACGGGGGHSASSPAPSSAAADDSGLSEAARLGQRIFRDASLSASGKMACISCHDPATGHASPFDAPVASGGADLGQLGLRNAPSLRYLRFNTSFHFAADGTPTGGFFWDGRANSLREQALGPLLNPREMANPDVAAVVAKLAAAPYADDFRKLFGDTIFSSPKEALDRAGYALERYQLEDPEFAPFSSKYDAFIAGNAKFTAQELNGFALFNRSDKGNCAACHSSTRPAHAPGALFTDFSYDNLGVPRNAAIAANADASFHDLGLCGGTRTDLASRTDLCGAFKVPSLRNVALRKHFFHNGAFDSLEQVIRFYVQRDTDPELWYAADATGQVTPYDDLPASLRANINTTEVPYNRRPGQAPALTEAEVQDLASFLRTLTDGYTP
jgi:cytochrome c peroxidase